MAKKPTIHATERAAKNAATFKTRGGSANKIVIATVVLVVAIIAVVAGVMPRPLTWGGRTAGCGAVVRR